MIKTTKWMLTALLMMGLSMGFVACSDDDDYDGGVPTNETEYKKSQLGWDIITQLTSERTAPEGWENMTFEPTIGKASDTDPYTRIVSTNDLAAAAERFGGLIGFPTTISETTNSFTYNQQGMGKLIYQKGSEDGEYLAQVEVDLKQVPHLKKILYQTPEQMGNNGYFDGTAYYRFGDVVMDTSGYYWICVRPAFGPEGKEDSHWMCLSHNLPDGNIKEYKTSTGIQDYIPTGLGKSTEHMQNTAEMFYAMLHPSDWVNALSLSTKPKMFNDFSYSNIRFHNMYFWKLVCKAWENENLFNLVLGVDKETLDKDKEWHMLYSGYSWWFTTSWECTLYEATFKNNDGKKANMHDVTYSKPTKDMHNISLDAKSGSMVGTVSGPFFDNDNKLRWYARYKKGSELGGGAYNVKTQINGCTDVYVFNTYYHRNLNDSPEETTEEDTKPKAKSMVDVTEDDRGKLIGLDGKIYNSKKDAETAGTKVVAMIVDTYNTNYEIVGDTNGKEKSWYENWVGFIKKGIAIALEDGNLSGESYDPFDYDNTAPKADKETTEVNTYDPTWNKNHAVKATNARWFVPNCYHWQRMLLPYGRTKIYLQSYIHDNLEEMTDTGEYDIDEGSAFVRDVAKAGNAFKNSTQYVVAGYWTTYKNEQSVYSIMLGESLCYWVNSANPEAVRYVLTW